MGQRLSANLFRLGRLRSWNSVWYSSLEYTYLVSLDYRIRDFMDGIFYNLKWPTSELKIKRFLSRTVVLEMLVYIPEDSFFKYLHFRNYGNNNSGLSLFKFNVFVSDFNYVSRFLYSTILSKSAFFLLLLETRKYSYYDKSLLRRTYKDLFGILNNSTRQLLYNNAKFGALSKVNVRSIFLYLFSTEFTGSISKFLKLLYSFRGVKLLKRKRLFNLVYTLYGYIATIPTKLHLVNLWRRLAYLKRLRYCRARAIVKFRPFPHYRNYYRRFKGYRKYDPFIVFSRYAGYNSRMYRRYRLYSERRKLMKYKKLPNLQLAKPLIVRKSGAQITRSNSKLRTAAPSRVIIKRDLRYFRIPLSNRFLKFSLPYRSVHHKYRMNVRWKKRYDVTRYRLLRKQLTLFKSRKKLFKSRYSGFKFLFVARKEENEIQGEKEKGKGKKVAGTRGSDSYRSNFLAKTMFFKRLRRSGKLRMRGLLDSGDYALFSKVLSRRMNIRRKKKMAILDLVNSINNMPKRNLISLFVRAVHYPEHAVVSSSVFSPSGGVLPRHTIRIRINNFRSETKNVSRFHRVRAKDEMLRSFNNRRFSDGKYQNRLNRARSFNSKFKLVNHLIGECCLLCVPDASDVRYSAIQFFSFFNNLWYLNSGVHYTYKLNNVIKYKSMADYNAFYLASNTVHRLLLLNKFTGFFNSFKFTNSIFVSIKLLRYFRKFSFYFSSNNIALKKNMKNKRRLRKNRTYNKNKENRVIRHNVVSIGKKTKKTHKMGGIRSKKVCLTRMKMFKSRGNRTMQKVNSRLQPNNVGKYFTLAGDCKKLTLYLMFMFSYIHKNYDYISLFLRNLLSLITNTLCMPVVSISYQVRICVYLFIYYFFNKLKLSSIVIRVLRLIYIFRVTKFFFNYIDKANKFLRVRGKDRKNYRTAYLSLPDSRKFKLTRRIISLTDMLLHGSILFRMKNRKSKSNYKKYFPKVSNKLYHSFFNLQNLYLVQCSLLHALSGCILSSTIFLKSSLIKVISVDSLLYNVPIYTAQLFVNQIIIDRSVKDRGLGVKYYKNVPYRTSSRMFGRLLTRRNPYFFRYVVDNLIYYLDNLRREVAPIQLVSGLNKAIEYEISSYLSSTTIFLPVYYLGKRLPIIQSKMVGLFVSYNLERGIPYFFVLKQVGTIFNLHKRQLRYYLRDRALKNIKKIFYSGISSLDMYINGIMRREFRQYKLNSCSVSLLKYTLFKSYFVLSSNRGFGRTAGLRIMCSGRMHRRQTRSHTAWFIRGAAPMRIFDCYIDYFSHFAVTALGVLGVKTWIYLLQFDVAIG